MDSQSSRDVGSKGSSGNEGDKATEAQSQNQFLVMMECEFDVLSLNTAGTGDSFKRRKVFNYPKKNCSSYAVTVLKRRKKYGITSGDVGKLYVFCT